MCCRNVVKTCRVHQRARLPYQVQDLQDFLNGVGIYDLDKGHNTMDTKKWREHKKRYGTNNVTRGFGKFTWRYSNMPFLYAFFTIIAGGIMAADNLLYEYKYWYA